MGAKLYVVDDESVRSWRDSLLYNAKSAHRGDSLLGSWTTNYVSSSRMLRHDLEGLWIGAYDEQETIGSIIYRVTGRRPQMYSPEEVRGAVRTVLSEENSPLRSVNGDRLVSECLRVPSITLSHYNPHDNPRDWSLPTPLDPDRTLRQSGIRQEAVLRLKFHPLGKTTLAIAYRLALELASACIFPVRDSTDFFDKLQWPCSGGTPAVVLLYTSEDVEISKYIRHHYDEIDKLSNTSSLFVLENPYALDPYKFWRSALEQKIYLAWKLLGWAESVPYDKSEIYTIARRLGVKPSEIPCAAVVDEDLHARRTYRLDGSPKTTLRRLFSDLTRRNTRAIRRSLSYLEAHRTELDTAEGENAGFAPLKLFILHAEADREYCLRLEKHLLLLAADGLMEVLHAGKLLAGDPVEDGIAAMVGDSQIVIALLSVDLLATARRYEPVLHLRAARHGRSSACIVPIRVRDADYDRTFFADLGILPRDGEALAALPIDQQDRVWTDIVQHIHDIIAEQFLPKEEARNWLELEPL